MPYLFTPEGVLAPALNIASADRVAHLLDGARRAGATTADIGRISGVDRNGDGVVDSAELYAYAAAMARLSARKTFGLLQEPVYSSAATPALSGSGAVASKPE